jgi:hypothetical protein
MVEFSFGGFILDTSTHVSVMDPVRPRGGQMQADINIEGQRTLVQSWRQGSLSIDNTSRDWPEASGPSAACECGMSPDTGYALRADIGDDA